MKSLLNITNRIISGGIIIIVIVFIISLLGIIILNKNTRQSDKILTTDIPVFSYLKDFNLLITESERLTNNCVYMANKQDREQLKYLHSEQYEVLKNNIRRTVKNLKSKEEREKIMELLHDFEGSIIMQKQIIGKLNSDEDYANVANFNAVTLVFTEQMNPKINSLTKQLEKVLEKKNHDLQNEIAKQKHSNNTLITVLIIIVIFVLISSIVIYILTQRVITDPLKKLKKVVMAIGNGENTNTGALKNRNSLFDGYPEDEIGEMITAIGHLVKGMKNKTDFAKEIGQGNFNMQFHKLSEQDDMGIALIEMRDKLKHNKEEDDKRNWVTEGIAQFAELLQENQDDFKKLADKIVSKLIKYTRSNQGALFIINDENPYNVFIEQVCCYAWERKKFNQKKMNLHEGLIGQAIQEKEYIYMTDIPNNYINIASGLGDSNPRSILIMPLKTNDEILGVIEMASFNKFDKYEIEFVKKIGESIAAAIKTAKTNTQTKKLLAEAQSMTEELKAQEEETRQNMEEMAVVQEEIQRREKEYINAIEELKTEEKRVRELLLFTERKLTEKEETLFKKEQEHQEQINIHHEKVAVFWNCMETKHCTKKKCAWETAVQHKKFDVFWECMKKHNCSNTFIFN